MGCFFHSLTLLYIGLDHKIDIRPDEFFPNGKKVGSIGVLLKGMSYNISCEHTCWCVTAKTQCLLPFTVSDGSGHNRLIAVGASSTTPKAVGNDEGVGIWIGRGGGRLRDTNG